MINEYYKTTDCSVEGQEYRRRYEQGLGLDGSRLSLLYKLQEQGLSEFDKSLVRNELKKRV